MIRQEWSEAGLSVRQQKICQTRSQWSACAKDVKRQKAAAVMWPQKVAQSAVSYLQVNERRNYERMDRSGAAILERDPDRNGKQMLLTHTALEEV